MKRLVTIVTAAAAVAACLQPSTASAGLKELGLTTPRPAASCPENCQAVGRVTGFQVQQGTSKNPYRVGRKGKIVGFSIALGRPRADQKDFFDNLFGGRASARLSILRPAKTKRRHRLTGQSELFDLEPYFGTRTTFPLSRPLSVGKGYVVALTVPTWAPAFAVGLGRDEAWRSSRDATDCENVRQPAAQETRGSLRSYGCFYRTARLLYTAIYISDPVPRETGRDEERGR